jgi:hypothetical protein
VLALVINIKKKKKLWNQNGYVLTLIQINGVEK